MQKWVDTLVADVGPKAEHARDGLAEEVAKWRLAPLYDKKARKEIAKAMVEGPPGPGRTGWKAAEAALTLLSAALARKAIEAFITGEKPRGPAKALRLAPPTPETAAVEYSGMSDRRA
jgi:hypothetical protein